MCTSYGVDPSRLPSMRGMEPLDDREHQPALAEWLETRGGRAAITGAREKNLNPVLHELSGARSIELGWWWLWKNASGPVKFSAFNAQSERLVDSPAWRGPFQRRGLLPASWFIEKKQTFSLPGGKAFGLAAVTNTVTLPDGTDLLTYTMVTRAAAGEVAKVHHRMPLVIPDELHDEWLDPSRPGDDSLVQKLAADSEEISRALVVESDMLF